MGASCIPWPDKAVCLLQGKKSELEKFAGAMFTTSVEGFVPATGKGVQVHTCSRPQYLPRMYQALSHVHYMPERRSLLAGLLLQ